MSSQPTASVDPTTQGDADSQSYLHVIPPRALALSLAALAVAVSSVLFFQDSLLDYGPLLWLLALAPAILLCTYRGWHRITLVLAIGMVLMVLFFVAGALRGWQLLDWPYFVFVVAAYIGLALGAGWMTELRAAVERRDHAEGQLRLAYDDLRASHTNLQLMQWKLIETEKLEAVGQLAAGVAHEVKNPLMTLLTGVRYLSQRLPSDDKDLGTLLEDMRTAVHRADTVIRGLLDFSAPRELRIAPAHLNGLITRAERMVGHEFMKAHVTFVKELAPDLPAVQLDASKMEQVLVNLFTNAAHATPPGGTITARSYVTTRRLVSGAAMEGSRDPLAMSDRIAVLEIDDTGTGIPEDKLGKLYDPFFTTKPPGMGTGLGLSVSRQIVEMHGATIAIRNREEGGARVTLAFDLPEKDTPT